METFDFDFIFGTDDKTPAPLMRIEKMTEASNDRHPLQQFFENSVVAAAVGGDENFSAFKTESALVGAKLAAGYRKIAESSERKTTVPIVATKSADSSRHVSDTHVVRKERTFFPSGGCVVAEMNALGQVVKTYEEN